MPDKTAAIDLQQIAYHDITWINCTSEQAAIVRSLFRTLLQDACCNCTVPPWATPDQVYYAIVDALSDYLQLLMNGPSSPPRVEGAPPTEAEMMAERLSRLYSRVNWKMLGDTISFRVVIIEGCFPRDLYDYQALLETLYMLSQTTGGVESLMPDSGANFLLLNTAPEGKAATHDAQYCHRITFDEDIDWEELAKIAQQLAEVILKRPFDPKDLLDLLKDGKLSADILKRIMNL